MTKWPWIQRTFSFDFPVTKFPDILERVRGTPARIEERVADLEDIGHSRFDADDVRRRSAAHPAELVPRRERSSRC